MAETDNDTNAQAEAFEARGQQEQREQTDAGTPQGAAQPPNVEASHNNANRPFAEPDAKRAQSEFDNKTLAQLRVERARLDAIIAAGESGPPQQQPGANFHHWIVPEGVRSSHA